MTTNTIDTDARAVLDFWFGAPGSATDGKQRPEWFRKSDAFDREIESRFAPLIARALDGELGAWDATPQGTLARIVVLDQFTRNVFRGTPRAFGGDALALAAAQALVARGADELLTPLQRVFAYLPFEHAESLAMQDESMRLFTRLCSGDVGFASQLDYARRHREIVQRFGRFPHRNLIVGRVSTAEELAFLEQPGSSF